MGQNWAIAIGINEYRNLPSLKYAVRDAELMKQWFEEEAKFNKTYLFTDTSPEINDGKRSFSSQPERPNLRYFLRTRFDRPFLQPGDNLWFFFSGHGLRHQNIDYLLPSDADPHPDEIKDSAISLSYITQRLRRCGADNIILILDACRNETGSKGVGIGKDKQQGVITIASCSPAEMSYEIAELQQGSFTYTLLQGLRIHGEGNCATVERLDRYLRQQVPEVNRNYRKPRQTPYTIAEPVSKHHLILLPDYIQPNLSDIALLREYALEAETENNLQLAEMLWHRLVKFDQQRALKALKRIWFKLENRDRVNDPTPVIPQDDKAGIKTAITKEKILEKKLDAKIAVPQEKISEEKLDEELVTKNKIQKFSFEVITVDETGKINSRTTKEAEFYQEDLGNGVTLDMVKIPGGSFMMGSPEGEGCEEEKPQHKVTVPDFWMGKYPVTQAQWLTVMGNNPSSFTDDLQNPVEQVSWNNAVDFCKQLTRKTGNEYRLPSEAEWEYACRAGTKTPFYFGSILSHKFAPCKANLGTVLITAWTGKTTPVGQFFPNNFGLYDMHGNIWEWCLDDWHENYKNAPKNSNPWLSENSVGKVRRGGSYYHHSDLCRSAFRTTSFTSFVSNFLSYRECESFIGFRIVRVISGNT